MKICSYSESVYMLYKRILKYFFVEFKLPPGVTTEGVVDQIEQLVSINQIG